MFWDSACNEETSLDVLLKSEDLNLTKLLADPFTLQELRNRNKLVIDFISRDEILVELITTALSPAVDESKPLKMQYKQSHLCCEILIARNNDELCEKFITNEHAVKALVDFMEDTTTMNHLVASFYMKIILHLLFRVYQQTMNVLENSDFIGKCLRNLHFGAISELLQSIVRCDPEDSDRMKLILKNERLIPRLIDLFDEKYSVAIHENVSDLYCELVRNLRHMLYTLDDKTDDLQDSLQSVENIQKITNIMIRRDENGLVNESLLKNTSEILFNLLVTNYIVQSPSHLLDPERQSDTWTGGMPGDVPDIPQEVWRPDEARNAERIISSQTADIINIIVEDLQSDLVSDRWLFMFRLLIALLDTNHLPTHESLLQGFRKANFRQLFDLVYEHPLRSIFHRQLHKLVSYIFYSNLGADESPLIAYLFQECDLIKFVASAVGAICVLPRLILLSLRSFHIQMAILLQQAQFNTDHKQHISSFLQGDDWEIVVNGLNEFNEWNKLDDDTIHQQSARSMEGMDHQDFFEGMPDEVQQTNHEFNTKLPCVPLPDIGSNHYFEPFRSELSTSGKTSPRSGDGGPKLDMKERDTAEDEFESQCQRKQSPYNDEWPSSNDKSHEGWPGDEPSGNKDFFADFNNSIPFSRNGDGWKDAIMTSTPKATEKINNTIDDEWADFSSAKPTDGLSTLTTNESAITDPWPGHSAKEAIDDWPTNPVSVVDETSKPSVESDC